MVKWVAEKIDVPGTVAAANMEADCGYLGDRYRIAGYAQRKETSRD